MAFFCRMSPMAESFYLHRFDNSEVGQMKEEHQRQLQKYQHRKQEVGSIITNSKRDIDVSIYSLAYSPHCQLPSQTISISIDDGPQ